MKHTKTPWEAIKTCVYFPNLAGGFDIGDCPHPEANAAFIVKAVNSHEMLVEQLRVLHDLVIVADLLPTNHPDMLGTRKALAQVEE